MYRNWTELIKPRKVELSGDGDARHKATMVVEPLERGFGTTLGNALRRVLISSLQGAAVSSVKIAGVAHGVAAVPGVVEDVTGIILNLKGVVVRKGSNGPQTMTLLAEKAGVVTAGDIDCGQGVQILNPDHPIATLTPGGKLDMVMTVTTGKGYIPAMAAHDDQSVDGGGIPLDCSYNPVKHASYQVSNARIGQQTDYDRLVFDIETNGVISPEDAMEAAAKLLRDQLGVFVNFDDAAVIEEQAAEAVPKWNPGLFYRIDEMGLSVRSANGLKGDGVVYVGDLVQKNASDLLKMPNFGRKSLSEITEMLGGMELSLGTQLDGWPPEDVEEMAKRLDL